MTSPRKTASRPRVVIVGSGFGGLWAARELKGDDVDITLIARTTHHLFQPLLYQVATGILSPGEIAPATREILARQRNVEVLLGEVTDIDLAAKTVTARTLAREHVHRYDHLVVAAGAEQSWFGNDAFADHAPGMKNIDDALELRGRIYGAFELAELAAAQGRTEDVAALMTFVVVGAGPTGVEMAGQLAELSRRTLKHDFRHIDPKQARILLIDGVDSVLSSFSPRLRRTTERDLTRLGVEVMLNTLVTDVDEAGLTVRRVGDRPGGGASSSAGEDAQDVRIEAVTKVWAAGVQASPLARILADQVGLEVDAAGRIPVNDDLTLPGQDQVWVVGDMITLDDLPGVAQVAIQGATHAAGQIRAQVAGEPTGQAFSYLDKGSMATISRFRAIAEVGPVKLSGVPAWGAWLGVHLVYLIGFKSRVTTLLGWGISFIGRGRAERTVTQQQVFARQALKEVADRDQLDGLPPTPEP